MRNYSNQQGGRPSGNTSRPSGNRGGGGYKGQGGGGHYRDHQGGRDNREHRGGGYRGGNRYEQRDDRSRGEHRGGEHRYGGNRSGGHSGGWRGGERHEHRHDREERPRHERPEGQGPRGSSWVEVTGRSVEEALEEASRRFNVNQADLKSETVEEGSKGFLGIGSKPAKIRISLKSSAVPAFAEGVLSRLLRGMSLPDKVKIQKDEDGNTVLNIQGPSSGTLIGRHGHTLEALQYLVSKMAQRVTGDEKSIVIVDVENYLERQKDKLKELAQNLAQKAKETGVEIPMRPMSSKDRRVVHLTLKDHEHVTTESRGEGLRRKVVIVPKVKAEPAPAAQPAADSTSSSGFAEATPDKPQAAAETPSTASTDSVQAAVAPAAVEPGNAAPVEVKTETAAPVASEIEPGNAAPKEPDVDDNIGNKV